jgi:putative tricarboxylic transport membrane protein
MRGRLAAAGFVAAAVAALWQAWEWGFLDFGMPGPGLFPALAAGLMGVSALIALRRRAPAPEPADRLRLFAYIAAILGFALLLEPLGMTACVALLLLALLGGLERMRWQVVVPVTALGSASCFLLFDKLLKVPMPRGWWHG